MATLPTIYAIQASDAPQHSETLRKILSELESEKRISGFTELSPDDDLSSVSDKLQSEDLIIILLTSAFEADKTKIENQLKTIKSGQPRVKVAEILIDNVVYDNEFITFPADLRPIRDREDMDSVWNSIDSSLKNMLPVKKKQEAKPFPMWMPLVAVGVLLLGVLFIFRCQIFGCGQDVEFTSIERSRGFDLFPREDVIRDEDQWYSLGQEIWESIVEETGVEPDLPEPPVDFTEEMVIRVTQEVNVVGFGPQFEQVQRFPEKIVAQYTVTVVGDDCNGPPQDTRTFAMNETISVPQSDLEVRFDAGEIARCPVQVPDVRSAEILEAIKQLDDRGLGWETDVLYGRYEDVGAERVVAAGAYEWVPPAEVLGLVMSIGPPRSIDPRPTDELLQDVETHPLLLRDGHDLRLDTTAIMQELQR